MRADVFHVAGSVVIRWIFAGHFRRGIIREPAVFIKIRPKSSMKIILWNFLPESGNFLGLFHSMRRMVVFFLIWINFFSDAGGIKSLSFQRNWMILDVDMTLVFSI